MAASHPAQPVKSPLSIPLQLDFDFRAFLPLSHLHSCVSLSSVKCLLGGLWFWRGFTLGVLHTSAPCSQTGTLTLSCVSPSTAGVKSGGRSWDLEGLGGRLSYRALVLYSDCQCTEGRRNSARLAERQKNLTVEE